MTIENQDMMGDDVPKTMREAVDTLNSRMKWNLFALLAEDLGYDDGCPLHYRLIAKDAIVAIAGHRCDCAGCREKRRESAPSMTAIPLTPEQALEMIRGIKAAQDSVKPPDDSH